MFRMLHYLLVLIMKDTLYQNGGRFINMYVDVANHGSLWLVIQFTKIGVTPTFYAFIKKAD